MQRNVWPLCKGGGFVLNFYTELPKNIEEQMPSMQRNVLHFFVDARSCRRTLVFFYIEMQKFSRQRNSNVYFF